MISLYELDKNNFNEHNYSIIIKDEKVVACSTYFKKFIELINRFLTKENINEYGPQILLLLLSYIKPFSPTITIITTLYKLWKQYKLIKSNSKPKN